MNWTWFRSRRAAATVPNSRASVRRGADYIRESILTPSAEVVEGYEDGLMPQDFSTQLSAEELDTLVAFLSSQ